MRLTYIVTPPRPLDPSSPTVSTLLRSFAPLPSSRTTPPRDHATPAPVRPDCFAPVWKANWPTRLYAILADLAELASQGFQLLVQHRADRVGDDVFDDGVGCVVGPRRLALGLVVGEIDLLLPHDDLGLLATLDLRLGKRNVRLALLVGLGRKVFVGDLEFEL